MKAKSPAAVAKFGDHLDRFAAGKDSRFWREFQGSFHDALQALEKMACEGARVPSDMLYGLLKGCIERKDLLLGRKVHALAVRSGYETDLFLGNHIIRMYGCGGSLMEANRVFSKLQAPDMYVWASIISAHVLNGQPEKGIGLYKEMRESGARPNEYVAVAVLKACAGARDVAWGKVVHSDLMERGLEEKVYVCNSLVDMYAKCGELKDAQRVFEGVRRKDVVTWNAMIWGYAMHGLWEEVLEVYAKMGEEGRVTGDDVTFVSVLKACGRLKAVEQGRRIHGQILGRDVEADVVVGNALVDMYAKCGRLQDARSVFDALQVRDVVTWSTMMGGYVEEGLCEEALKLYECMQQDGMRGDRVTFSRLLKACGSMGALQDGKRLHAHVVRCGLEADLFVGTTLVDMYIKCGSLEDAQAVFDNLPRKDVATWSSMISGYAHDGLGQGALKLYESMLQNGIVPDNGTFLSALKACGSVGAVQEGKRIHAQISERGLENDVFLASTLVDMYAKCGSLEDAQNVFNILSTSDVPVPVVAWNAMIGAYAKHNDYSATVKFFDDMQRQGVQPDAVTFTSLLMACSHVGKVNEGCQYFNTMVEKHGITPEIHHYTSLVDLFGRSGCLDEAEKMLRSMPSEWGSVGWISLLSACKTFSNIEAGRRCFDRLMELDCQQSVGYVLMLKIYADAGMWKEVEDIDNLRKCAGVEKKLASAVIEVDNKVHEFTVGEMRDDIAAKLKSLNLGAESLPHEDLDALNKEDDALCGHAEKLALAFGLLNTPQGSTLLVTKNLRMCDHCHTGTKLISRLERREIVVRDAHRVHHFKDGTCSCGDHH